MSIEQHLPSSNSPLRWWKDSFFLIKRAPVRWYCIGLVGIIFIVLVISTMIASLTGFELHELGEFFIAFCVGLFVVLISFSAILVGIASAGNVQMYGEKPKISNLLKGFKIETAGFAFMVIVVAVVICIATVSLILLGS